MGDNAARVRAAINACETKVHHGNIRLRVKVTRRRAQPYIFIWLCKCQMAYMAGRAGERAATVTAAERLRLSKLGMAARGAPAIKRRRDNNFSYI